MQVGIKALAGVGLKTKVWIGQGGNARGFPTVHVRRKTTEQEERKIGPVIDIRGTERHRNIVREMSRLTKFDERQLLELG